MRTYNTRTPTRENEKESVIAERTHSSEPSHRRVPVSAKMHCVENRRNLVTKKGREREGGRRKEGGREGDPARYVQARLFTIPSRCEEYIDLCINEINTLAEIAIFTKTQTSLTNYGHDYPTVSIRDTRVKRIATREKERERRATLLTDITIVSPRNVTNETQWHFDDETRGIRREDSDDSESPRNRLPSEITTHKDVPARVGFSRKYSGATLTRRERGERWRGET